MATDNSNCELGMATLQFLLRSRNRLRVLCRLSESPATKTELHQDLSVARSTVRRLVSELEERGWIYHVGSTCHVGYPAHLVVESVKTTISDVDTATRLTEFFSTLPTDTRSDFDDLPVEEVLENLGQVRVTLPSKIDPYGPQARIKELLSEVTWIRGFSPTVEPLGGALTDKLENAPRNSEFIVESSGEEILMASDDPSFSGGNLADGIQLLEAEHIPPYALIRTDTGLILIGFDRFYRAQAVVSISDECDLVMAWADEMYERVQAGAQPVA